MRVYEAGVITHYYKQGQLEKATLWRKKLKDRLSLSGIECFDPTQGFYKHLAYTDSSIVRQNQHYLNQCDIMVVNIDDLIESPGTMYEIFDYYKSGKPVIAFGEQAIP